MFLLLGAVVNVAVAWGITAGVTYPGWPPSPTLAWDVEWPRPVPDHWPERASTIQGQIFGWRFDQYQGTAVEMRNGEPWATEEFRIDIASVGWPCHALRAEQWVDFVYPHPEAEAGRHRFDGQPRRTWWLCGIPLQYPRFGFDPQQSLKSLPVRPIWPGFAINTIFYATLLWLLIPGTFALRRFLRLKRGLCPKCAYPMGGSSVCTECGGPLAKHAAIGSSGRIEHGSHLGGQHPIARRPGA